MYRSVLLSFSCFSLAACAGPSTLAAPTPPQAPPTAEPAPALAPAPAPAPVVAATTTTALPEITHAHWGYDGATGPSHWGSLEADWKSCQSGRAQSPIDLRGAVEKVSPELSATFGPTSLRIVHQQHTADMVNTGHSLQINFPAGNVLSVGDKTYELLQFHFHTPSEHTVNGKSYPMEMHLVHRAASGNMAVLGVFFEEGAANQGLAQIMGHLPQERGIEYHVPAVQADGSHVLPPDRTTFRYQGSLTTPPCTEGVEWILFANSVAASTEQIAAIAKLEGSNHRPTQPLNGRVLSKAGQLTTMRSAK